MSLSADSVKSMLEGDVNVALVATSKDFGSLVATFKALASAAHAECRAAETMAARHSGGSVEQQRPSVNCSIAPAA